VARALDEFAAADTVAGSRRRRLEALRERTPAFSASQRQSREALYGGQRGRR
jgi:hypothetical protein